MTFLTFNMRHMSLCLPGYYGEMCSSAVPLVPVRGAGVGYVGSRPTCHLALAPFWRAAVAAFREAPRSFRSFWFFAMCAHTLCEFTKASVIIYSSGIQ